MKLNTTDENGFPIGINIDSFYKTKEKFVELNPMLFNTKSGNYYISNHGRLYNKQLNSYVPRELFRDKNIYVGAEMKDINENRFHVQIHQLVALTFLPIPAIYFNNKKYIPNHIDGVKWHNEPYNLEWVTMSENTIHADLNNLISRPNGEDNGSAKLTDNQYRQICELTQQGYKAYQINKIMNVGFDITNICQKIRRGSSLTMISSEYDFSNIPTNDYRKFTEEQVRIICQYLQDYPGIKYKEILNRIGYDVDNLDPSYYKKLRDTISTIKRRVSYIEIGKDYLF